jgi:putative transposase
VVTYKRTPFFENPAHVNLLRTAFRKVRARRPFAIDAIVVLPDHLHCIWRLPEGDADYAGRWREIKKFVTPKALSAPPFWQRRFWEHTIRSETDWRRHVDYIHYNPVRHGLAEQPGAWRWSSFARCVERGWYEPHWGMSEPEAITDMHLE